MPRVKLLWVIDEHEWRDSDSETYRRTMNGETAWEDLTDDEFKMLVENRFALRGQYYEKAVIIRQHDESLKETVIVSIKDRLAQLQRTKDADLKRRAAEAEKRKANLVERKRKQLEKLKRELEGTNE